MGRHTINLTDAWEPPGGARAVWTRRFGRPAGLTEETRLWLLFERAGAIASVTLNDTPLLSADGAVGPPACPLRLDITAALRPRNTLVMRVMRVMPAAESTGTESTGTGHEPRVNAAGRGPLPTSLGRVWLEIDTGDDDRAR